MSTRTANYSFEKPDVDEKYNVNVFNGNVDAIDNQIARVEQIVGDKSVLLRGSYVSETTFNDESGNAYVPNAKNIYLDISGAMLYVYEVSTSSYVPVTSQFELPIANEQTLGGIKPDGITIEVDEEGVASAIGGGGGGEVIYSYTERVVGKWVNNKDVYEKTIQLTIPSNTGISVVNSGIYSVENIIDFSCMAINNTLHQQMQIPSPWGANTNSEIAIVFGGINQAIGTQCIIIFNRPVVDVNWANVPAKLVVRYTKM